jgi:predicted transcriptional regulator
MSTTRTIDPDALRLEVPEDLQSPESKLVYLFLATTGGATVDDLHRALDIKRISLFPVLGILDSQGLIERDGDAYLAA